MHKLPHWKEFVCEQFLTDVQGPMSECWSERSPQLTYVFDDSWKNELLWIFQHHKFSLRHILTSYAHYANKNRPQLRNSWHISLITECYIPGSEHSVPLIVHTHTHTHRHTNTHLHTLKSGRTWLGKSLLASVWFSANRLFITLWLTIHLHF